MVRKISHSLGFDQQIVQPITSQYTDYDIRGTITIIIIIIITPQRCRVIRGTKRKGFTQHTAGLMGAVSETERNHKQSRFIQSIGTSPTTKKTKLRISKRLRRSRGRVLAFGTQVREFKPGRSRRIFQGGKILSTPSFGGEIKPCVP